jgi:hypothetical protein
MAFPNLTPAYVAWLAGQTQAYIAAQRAVYHSGAVQLTPAQTTTMSPFFVPNILGSARLNVLPGTHVTNPPFYPQLVSDGFPQAALPDFSAMAAITFIDTVVFQVPITDRTRSLDAIPTQHNAAARHSHPPAGPLCPGLNDLGTLRRGS